MIYHQGTKTPRTTDEKEIDFSQNVYFMFLPFLASWCLGGEKCEVF